MVYLTHLVARSQLSFVEYFATRTYLRLFFVLIGLHLIYLLGYEILHGLQLRTVGYDLIRAVHELRCPCKVEIGDG